MIGHYLCMSSEGRWLDIPIYLHASGEMRHRIAFEAETGNAQLAAFDDGRAGTAKGIKYAGSVIGAETLEVSADQMRGVREDEAVPLVYGAVGGTQPVVVAGQFHTCTRHRGELREAHQACRCRAERARRGRQRLVCGGAGALTVS